MATTRPAADIDLRRAPWPPRAKYEPMAHPGTSAAGTARRSWRRWEWVAQTGSIPRRIDWCGERPRARRRGAAKMDARAPAVAEQLLRRGPLRLLERGARGGRPSRAQPDVRDLGRRPRRVGASAGCRRHDDPRDRRRARRLGVERAQLPERRRLSGLRSPRDQPARATMLGLRESPSRRSLAPGRARAFGPRFASGARNTVRRRRTGTGRRRARRASRWAAQSPRWPSAAVVCDLYSEQPSPWNAALVDAGARVRFHRWSDEAIRAALAGFWIQTGRVPHDADLRGPDWHGPHPATLRRRYGSLATAWSLLGPVPRQQPTRERRLPA